MGEAATMRLGVRGGFTFLAFTAALCLGAVPSATGAAPGVKIDIEMAFDPTGSMASSLGAAQQDAVGILEGVRAVVPDAQFAVVSFRGHGNPGGEYGTLRPRTMSTAA